MRIKTRGSSVCRSCEHFVTHLESLREFLLHVVARDLFTLPSSAPPFPFPTLIAR